MDSNRVIYPVSPVSFRAKAPNNLSPSRVLETCKNKRKLAMSCGAKYDVLEVGSWESKFDLAGNRKSLQVSKAQSLLTTL